MVHTFKGFEKAIYILDGVLLLTISISLKYDFALDYFYKAHSRSTI